MGGFSTAATRTASVLALTLAALGVLAAVSRPLSGLRLIIVAAMCAGVVLLMTVPLLREFFMLEWPPAELATASVVTAATAVLGIVVLGRAHARRFSTDERSQRGQDSP